MVDAINFQKRYPGASKCDNCCPDPLFMIKWDFGIKEFKEPVCILRRVLGKRTLFNWFPEDEGILEGEFGILSGVAYDDMLRYALGSGMKVKIVGGLNV